MNTEPQTTTQEDELDTQMKAANIAAAQMLGDLRDCMLNIVKHKNTMGKSWADMTESEQRETVSNIEYAVKIAIKKAVDIIKADGHSVIPVLLEQVVFKDGIKGVFTCSKSNELRHELADAEGGTVLVIPVDAEKFLGTGDEVEIDKDEPELPMDEEPDAGAEGEDEPDHDPETGEIDADADDDAGNEEQEGADLDAEAAELT